MARRASAKTTRRKEAKRQRAAEKRSYSTKRKPQAESTPEQAEHRLSLLRGAAVKGETPPPRGMLNLGNTCYFNAVMQNFARVAAVRDYFVGTPPNAVEGAMTTSIRVFINSVWDLNKSSILDPSPLLTQVGKANPTFRGRAQQDSHELMRIVLTAVIQEEKKRLSDLAKRVMPFVVESAPQVNALDLFPPESFSNEPYNNILLCGFDSGAMERPDHIWDQQYAFCNESPRDAAADSGTVSVFPTVSSPAHAFADLQYECPPLPQPIPSVAYDLYDKSPTSEENHEGEEDVDIPHEEIVTIIEKIFGGMLSSTIVCKACGNKSSVLEPFLDLQLPLVPKEESDVVGVMISDISVASSSSAKVSDSNQENIENAIEFATTSNVSVSNTEKKPLPQVNNTEQYSSSVPLPLRSPPSSAPPAQSTANSEVNCSKSLMELQQKCPHKKERPLLETKVEDGLLLYGSPAFESMLSPGGTFDTYNHAFQDSDNTDEFCGISSLFDTDFDIGTDMAPLRDVSKTKTFMTSEPTESEKQKVASAKNRKLSSPPTLRRPSSFISSLLGGLAGGSGAPHGYKSLIGSFEEFTSVEILEGENAYGCDECTRREKLRLAVHKLAAKSTPRNVKKSYALSNDSVNVTNSCADGFGTVDTDFSVEDSCTPNNPVKQRGERVSITDVHFVENVDNEILMSSPVTSSESSSGVNSEDDGELTPEEELEDPVMTCSVFSSGLNREQEDDLINQFKVEIPIVLAKAEKRFMICQAPDVLAVQLKRFTQIGYRGGLRKLSGHVQYPLTLDLTPFVDSDTPKESTSEDRDTVSPRATRRVNKQILNVQNCTRKREKYEYVLTGVCVHSGSLTGGHYMAFVREAVEPDDRGSWYFCNDSRVSRASEKDVLNSEAYLLYYERVLN